MPTIADIRQKYPQYDDMSDGQLASALHRKYYSDMPEEQFKAKIGMAPQSNPHQSDGLAMNGLAGVNTAIYSTLGAPVDLARGAINYGIQGTNYLTGTSIPQIPTDSFGGSESISSMFGTAGVPEPKNVRAGNTMDRIARGAGEGAGYTIAPEMLMSKVGKLAEVYPEAAKYLQRLFAPSKSAAGLLGNSAIGAASGAGAAIGQEAAPESAKPLASLVGGLGAGGVAAAASAIPGVVKAGSHVVGDYLAPLTVKGQERLAAERLAAGSSDLTGLRASLDNPATELVPGSNPTTFQQTGDMGLGGMERAAQAQNPEQFAVRRAEQNSARIGILGGIQPTGAPEKVAEAARTFVKGISDHAQAVFDDTMKQADAALSNTTANATETASAAQSRAIQSVGALGEGMSPTIAGDNIRSSIETARAAAKDAERKLWSVVDPDGTLALPAENLKQQASSIFNELPKSAKSPSGEEADIFSVVNGYKGVMPFKEITALQSRVKTELRTERLANGESPAYRRLSQLNSAIEKDLESAVANKMQDDAAAVARGDMAESDTLAAIVQRSVDAWRARKQEGYGDPGAITADGSIGTSGRSSVSGSNRTGVQAGRVSGGFAGDTELSSSPLSTNFDQGAADRLRAARDATRQRVETFDNGTLGPIRKRPSTVSPYDMASEAVPAKIFHAGASSPSDIQSYRKAVGDTKALPVLQNFAIDRLRKTAMEADGTFNPNKVDAWRRQHADALRAFPELNKSIFGVSTATKAAQEATKNTNAAISEAVKNVTRASADAAKRQKETIDAVQRTRLGQLMGLSDPTDITRTIGSVFERQDAVNQMALLRKAIGSDQEALQGLRKSVVDHISTKFVGNTEVGTSGQALIKADQFQTFIRQNKGALRMAGFTDVEVGNMQAIADDIQRANRSVASVRIPGGSNTAQDLTAIKKGDKSGTILSKIILAAVGGGSGFVAGGGVGSLAGVIGAQTVGALREAGIKSIDDLVTDALLSPARARVLLSKATTRPDTGIFKIMAHTYSRAAVASTAQYLRPANSGSSEGPNYQRFQVGH